MKKELSPEAFANIQKAQSLCSELLRLYIQNLTIVQKKCFDAAKNVEVDEKSSWKKKFNTQLMVSKVFMTVLEKQKPYLFLEKAYFIWLTEIWPIVRSCDRNVQLSCMEVVKVVAGHLLLSGDYPKAVVCLRHIVTLNEDDRTGNLLLLLWLCYMGEWEVVKYQLKTQLKLSESTSKHYSLIIQVITEAVALNIGNNEEKEKAVKTLKSYWASLHSEKTFYCYQAKALIKYSLFIASHLPEEDWKKALDPLKCLVAESNILFSLTRSRYREFCSLDRNVDISDKLFNPDFFLNLCSSISEYFDMHLLYCRHLLEIGILRDFEVFAFNLWQHSLRFGIFPRVISIGNLLLSSTLMAKNTSINANSVQEALVSYLHPTSCCRDSIAVKLNGIERRTESDDGKLITINFVDVEKYPASCSCSLCQTRSTNSQFSLDVECSEFFLSKCSSLSWQKVLARFREASSTVFQIIRELARTMNFSFKNKVKASKPLRDSFLFVAVRFLLEKAMLEKTCIRDEILQKAYKVCCQSPLQHRQYWLLIRQIARKSMPIIDGPWMKIPVELIADHNELSAKFKALSIKSHRRHDLTDAYNELIHIDKNWFQSVQSIYASYQKDNIISITEAKSDFDKFGHLFYREWRFLICSYLAQIYLSLNFTSWDSAYYFTEATCIATRQIMRSASVDNSLICYNNTEDFMGAVKNIPKELTVVLLFLDYNRILWLIRLHSDRNPLVIPVVKISEDSTLLNDFSKLLEENEVSAKLFKCTDENFFWQWRHRLDEKLKAVSEIICDVQSQWFRYFVALLLPCQKLTTEASSIINFISDQGFSEDFATVMVENLFRLNERDWQMLVEQLASLENISQKSLSAILQSYGVWYSAGKQSLLYEMKQYSVLSVTPELALFPFELMPVLESFSEICRIPSLYFITELLKKSKEIPFHADGKKTSYLLDPDGNLHATRNRFSSLLKKCGCWKGSIGQVPNKKDLLQFMETSCFFFYMGHGNGARYFGQDGALRNSCCRAVSILMGCSSARILHEGQGFDGRSCVYDYHIAKCPCLIGCLWMVTDGEIDRFFCSFLKHCFDIGLDSSSSEKRPTHRFILDGLASARYACKLRYLTGASVVAYGLPIIAQIAGIYAGNKNLP